MKISDLLEGKWVAKSLDGVERRFKDAKDAEAWRQTIAKKPRQPKLQDPWDAFDKAQAALKPSAWDIWTKFETAVSNSFPDGDYADYMGPYMQKHNLSYEDLNAAVKKYGHADSASDYLAQMWDDASADAMHDAEQGAHGETYGGQWFTHKNPWK